MKSSFLKKFAMIASAVALLAIGSTLAANISLGTNASLEFGQGVQVTSACDNSITLTPRAKFVNGSTPTFFFSTISFSDIDASSTTACQGRTLLVSAYGDTDMSPLQLATVGGSALTEATIGLTSTTPTSSAGTVISNVTGDGTTGLAFDLGFSDPSATSGAVYKMTLQSSN